MEEPVEALSRALDLAGAGRWEDAHQVVQEIEHPIAYWIHAVVHKVEGDRENSGYWYARAGRTARPDLPASQELLEIRQALRGEPG